MSDFGGECGTGCSAKAPYALRVTGDSMEPEFQDGAVIIVDPDHPAFDGAYVVADCQGETTFRQLRLQQERRLLVALKDGYPEQELGPSDQLRGVVTQQARNRKQGLKRAKHYV